jgi:hypothetical protein
VNGTSVSYTLKGTQNITGTGTISNFTVTGVDGFSTAGYKITATEKLGRSLPKKLLPSPLTRSAQTLLRTPAQETYKQLYPE